MDDFRRFFLRGLAAVVPTLLTIAIIIWTYHFINEYVATYITMGLRQFCGWVREEPATWLLDPNRLERDALAYGTPIDEWDEFGRRYTVEYKVIRNYELTQERRGLPKASEISNNAKKARNRALWRLVFAKWRLNILGFLLAIVLVYFTGFFLASFIGRTSWRVAEGVLCRIPLIRAIYPNVKQVTDFLLSDRAVEFSGVVAVQYPRKDVWSLGLSTGAPMRQLQDKVSEELVTVFIPSSPTPMTGYVVQLPRADVVELNMTIDEGLRFTISGGVIKPGAVLPTLPRAPASLRRDKGPPDSRAS